MKALLVSLVALLLVMTLPLASRFVPSVRSGTGNVAAAFSLTPTFGGRILQTIPCTCDEGAYILIIGPPSPAYILYRVGISTLYEWYLPFTGRWALGTYSDIPGTGVCYMYAGTTCVPWTTEGLITKIGTSVF